MNYPSLVRGLYALQAQTAADQALASYNATQAAVAAINTAQTDANATASAAALLSPVSLAPATSAISTAQPAITSAQSAVSAAQALAPAATATATANATAAAALASTAAAQASTATTKYNANGSFADATIAVPAFTALTAANSALQTANAAVQSAAGTATAQNTLLANSQSAAATAISSASTSLSSANSAVTNATAQNAALATAQSAVSSATSSIPAYLSTAQTAASAAQATAQAAQAAATLAQSLQSAGDFIGAQAQLTVAQQQLTIAQQQQATAAAQLTAAQSAASTAAAQSTAAQTAVTAAQTQVTSAVSAANTAATDAATASTSAAAAQTAKPLADAAVAATTSGLSATQAGAPLVQQNAVLAQYSNPAVASTNFAIGLQSLKSVTGGSELAAASAMSANTNYVLDGNNSLVEIRNAPYTSSGLNYSDATISNADITFSGGAAADAHSDPNGTYYMGRWSGGQIMVTDLAATNPVAPFTTSLGASSAQWIIGLAPGNLASDPSINNVQQLVGTANYTLAAATHPTDAFGDVGTLNSATLAANFSAQTVNANLNLSFSSTDTVNVSTRNLSLTASATNVPILNTGFQAAAGGPFAPTVTCTGTNCATSYTGGISGMFLAAASGGSTTGAVGSEAAISYGFTPVVTSPTANQPYTDLIQGVAALSTASAPTAGTASVPIASGTGTYRELAYLPQSVGANTYLGVYNLASGAAMNASNYVFDSSGNLVRMQSADYKLSDRGGVTPPSYSNGALPYTGSPGALPSSPLTGVTVSFSGGTTPDASYNDTVDGIRMGRYTGGTITTTDFSNPDNPLTYYTQLGNNSLDWVVSEIPVSIPTTGSFQYNVAYATKPTDSLGNVGTLDYASLSANFTTQTVSPAVGITINNQNLSAAATSVPINSQFGFDVSSNAALNTSGGGTLRVNCYGSNCAPAPVGANTSATPDLGYIYNGYGGRITGGLAGATTAGGAFFRYTFDTYYNPLVAAGSTGGIPTGQTRPVNDYIDGLVAFTQGLTVAGPATATPLIDTTFFQPLTPVDSNLGLTQDYSPSATTYTSAFGTGSSNTVADYDPGNPTPHSETITGGTVTQAPTNANSYAATGISYGSYSGGTISGTDWQGDTYPSFTNPGNYAWIMGPSTPLVTSAMTGTATYAYDGGTVPTSLSGSAGTLQKADLAVNFNTSSVGVDLQVAAGGQTWTATTTPTPSGTPIALGNPATTVRLNFGQFNAYTGAPSGVQQSLFATLTDTTHTNSSTNAQIDGQLMGSNLSGAGMTYAFQDFSTTIPTGVNGAVAYALSSYTSSPVTTNASGSSLPTQTTTTGTSAINLGNVPYMIGLVASGLVANPSATPANAPASVDSQYLTWVHGLVDNPGRVVLGANGLPTVWDGVIPATTIPTGCSTCSPSVTEIGVRASIDPSSFVPYGATPGPGQIALPTSTSAIATVSDTGFDPTTGISWGRYGGGVIAMFDRITGAAIGISDVSTQNRQFIQGPVMTGPTMLPLTGTYTYTYAGGTHPTDNFGDVGTLNAATLAANFSAMTVSTGVNLTINHQTWAAGASAVPIQQGQYFQASGGNLNVCVGSSCGTTTLPTATANTTGNITGAFTGTTGQGVAMAYSLNQNGINGTTVSGVAAFHR